jgi:hypothetical protein
MITIDEARTYLSKLGKKGKHTLELIDSLAPFVAAMDTDIGKELLKDDIERHGILINKIYNDLIRDNVASQADAIELKLRHEKLQTIYDRLKSYYVNIKMVKNVAKDE